MSCQSFKSHKFRKICKKPLTQTNRSLHWKWKNRHTATTKIHNNSTQMVFIRQKTQVFLKTKPPPAVTAASWPLNQTCSLIQPSFTLHRTNSFCLHRRFYGIVKMFCQNKQSFLWQKGSEEIQTGWKNK